MLAKLLKYDFKSMMKLLPLLWGASIVLAFINHFTVTSRAFQSGGVLLGIIGTIIPMLLFVAVVIGMSVMTLIYIMLRYYKGLLKDEGYLMFTLPVKPWQLITSKGIAAVTVTVITGIAGIASGLILIPWESSSTFLSSVFRTLTSTRHFSTLELIVLWIEAIIIILASIAKSVYQIYAAISLGHLFRKHRVAMSFVMYIAINIVLTVIASVIISPLFGVSSDLTQRIAELFKGTSTFGAINLLALVVFLVTAVQLAAFHVISERILSKKLNLE